MCLYAMNSAYALIDNAKDAEIDYRQAVSDLLNIESFNIAEDAQKYINWLVKYGTCQDFIREYPKEIERPPMYPVGDYMNLDDSDTSHLELLKAELKKSSITYIDEEYAPPTQNYQYVNLKELVTCKKRLQAIANLFSFTNGGKLLIQPIEANGHPILPDIVTDWLGGFIDWYYVEKIVKGVFLLPDDLLYHLDYDDPSFKFFDDDARKIAKTFKDTGGKKTAEITEEDNFGMEYRNLAEEIIYIYLDKCSSYVNFHNDFRYFKYKYIHDFKTGEYREIGIKDVEPINPEPIGYYKMHNILSTAIIDGHLCFCENCKKPFIPKRKGAKSCSNKCRVQMSLRKKYFHEYIEEQGQPHAEG